MSSAITVTSGISALRSACLKITLRRGTPLAPRGADVVGASTSSIDARWNRLHERDDLHGQRQHRQRQMSEVVEVDARLRRRVQSDEVERRRGQVEPDPATVNTSTLMAMRPNQNGGIATPTYDSR